MIRILQVTGLAAWLLLGLAACGKDDKPPGMPEGYERVDAAFGLRLAGAEFKDGIASVPVVEFRTGGDYAMYPLTTDCQGEFMRGAGLQFAADGTVRENLPAQPLANISANPPFSALYQRICTEAKAHRFVPDPFDARSALALVYGPLDGNGEAKWLRPASKDEAAKDLLVSLRWSGPYSEGGKSKMLLVTGSRDPACEAHACGGGIVGAAIFVKDGDKWQLESDQREVFSSGQYGQVAAAEGFGNLRQGPGVPLLAVASGCFGNGGYCETPTSLMTISAGRAVLAWSEVTSNDSTASMECVEQGACTQWSSSLTLGTQGSFPDLVLARSGKEWNQDSLQVMAIQDSITYRWDGIGKYVEASRTGTPIALPPLEETIPEQAAAPAETARPRAAVKAPQKVATPTQDDDVDPYSERAEDVADAAAEAAQAAADANARRRRPDLDALYENRRSECARGFLGSDCRRKLREQLCQGNWTDTPEQGRLICQRK